MKVIGVVGFPASGKGEFSEVARGMGIPVVVMGDLIRDVVRKTGLPLTDVNAAAVSRKIREEEGMGAIAKRLIPVIESCNDRMVVVDGIRGDAEVEVFRERFPDFVLVAIDAPFEERLLRLRARGREDLTSTEEDLRARDDREKGWGLDRAMSMADIILENTGTREEFRQRVRDILDKLRGG
ncbi:MAG: AAA family ATPase [Methanoculleaceae archaeon]